MKKGGSIEEMGDQFVTRVCIMHVCSQFGQQHTGFESGLWHRQAWTVLKCPARQNRHAGDCAEYYMWESRRTHLADLVMKRSPERQRTACNEYRTLPHAQEAVGAKGALWQPFSHSPFRRK